MAKKERKPSFLNWFLGKKPLPELPKTKEETLFKVEKITEVIALPELSTSIDVRYPLIPPYAYAHIFWDPENNELVYHVEEPELNEDEKRVLKMLEDGVRELINISFINIQDQATVIEYLEKNLKVLLNEFKIRLETKSFLKMMYYIYRDFIGMNEIEPMLNDYFIEDIECNGSKTPLYIVHRKYRHIRTNVIFPENKPLMGFVEKLAQKCGKYVSYASPLLDGVLPEGSRVNATYTTDITSRGPTFTIRMFAREPWTPIKLMDFGTVSPEILAYLWLLIEHERNIMVIGGTGSGKTSFLNSIAFFIPPASRIVSIEDTRELNMLHENWLPSVARTGVGLETAAGKRHGEVSLFTLLKESFRQRPDYVIVGEIRGEEAFVLFQGAASIKGDEKILVLNDEHPRRIAIKDLKDDVRYKAVTIDPKDEKVKILPVRFKIKHAPRELLYKIVTKSGREVTVTPDHSVFGYDNKIMPLRVEELKAGDSIVVPAKLPCGYADIRYINLIEELDDVRVYAPDLIRGAVKRLGYDKCCEICGLGAVSDYYANFTKHKASALQSKKFIRLMKHAKICYDFDNLKVRLKYCKKINPRLELNKEFLKLMGYYLSEGTLNDSKKNSRISFYNKDKKVLEDIRKCIKKVTKKEPKERIIDRGYGGCTELSFSSKIFCELIKKDFGKGNTKRIADFIFGLSQEKIGWFLSGLWAGDGSLTKHMFGYYTSSRILANDITQLLLVYNILCKITKRRREGRNKDDYELIFYSRKEKERFLKYVDPVNKKVDLSELRKISSKKFVNDVYVDKIKSISKISLDKKEPVYDISVPGTQNFIGGFGGLMLHNSGHPSMSTMHADSVETMINRLETPPISLSPGLVETLDIVCVMIQTKVGGKPVRRLRDITEIINVSRETGKAITNTPFVRDPAKDIFYFKADSRILDEISKEHGIAKQTLYQEFKLRTALLMAMYRQKIFGFKEVQEIINQYSKDPRRVLKRFGIIR